MTNAATKESPRRLRVLLGGLAGITGALIALALAAHVERTIGPFETTVSAHPAFSGHTVLRVPPLGTVAVDTHDSPVRLEIRLDELRGREASALARDPSLVAGLEDDLVADVRSALRGLVLRGLVVGVVGGAVAAAAASRRVMPTIVGAVAGCVTVGLGAGVAAATWRPEAISEPRYSGLLSAAPQVVGDAKEIVDRFGEYRAELAQLVGNVAALYRTGSAMAPFDPEASTVRVLHVSDIHLNPQAYDVMDELIEQFRIDVVVDTGDTTSWGTALEGRVTEAIAGLAVPYLWVRGNHDSRATQAAVAAQRNAVVLDGEQRSVAGLTFFGVGDPRFTPDKSQPTGKDVERDAAEAFAPRVAAMLRASGSPPDVDVLLVHDARIAAGVGDLVPLVLAGHTHKPRQARIGGATLVVQGTTGGGGFAALQGEVAESLSCGVLYFNRETRRLVAYDQITVDGIGERGAHIERTVIKEGPSRVSPSTSASGS